MGNKRIKRLIICLTILTVLTTTVTVLSGSAETYPDLSNLDTSYYYPYNQQFFHRPGGGYLLASTDNVQSTLVTLLDASGNPDESLGGASYRITFIYEKAAVSGDYLYLAGENPSLSYDVQLCRFSINKGSRFYNHIPNVNYDLGRGFSADTNGNLYLVTVPYGSELNSSSPFWVYSFNTSASGANCTGVPAPDYNPDSSESPSSNPAQESSAPSSTGVSEVPSSNSPSDSSQAASSAVSSASQPAAPDAEPYLFSGPITVESLQQQLDADGRGARVRVTSANGSPVTSGSVGTGFMIEVLLNGQTESCITAVVPGDLTGAGSVTEQDKRILYEHVTNQKGLDGLYFQAADLNKNGKVDTGDMLRIKSMIN